MNPLVSVCIPTYNGALFLEEALKSVSAQTYRNLEIIVSDDESKDTTLELVEEFRKGSDFPVTILKHRPSGIGANWNNCIEHSNGEYIKFLFQDDLLYPECIFTMVKAIQENESIGLVASKRKLIVEEFPSEEIDDWIREYSDLQKDLEETSGKFILTKLFLKEKLFFKNPINKIGEPSTVLFKKSLIRKTGAFREDLEQILDYEFYFRILKYQDIVILNEELVGFRLHSFQATNRNRKKGIKDYMYYDRILYDDFFWNLNYVQQKRLLFKFYAPYRKFRRLIYFLKSFLSSKQSS